MSIGHVYLVGAGPGDTRLMTVKGQECLEQADVVLYDRLVNPLLLESTKPGAELIYCGKLPDRHILRQEAINDLLVKYGQQGKKVVRLKGGDPSVYGRVGEEAEALDAADVPYEIVPGITASIGAATYAGVPVTHRDHGASFAMITGHDKSPNGQPLMDWAGVATGIDTIAFYMGVKNLPYICEQLIAHGRDEDTPVMLIQWGTLGQQKTLEGTLATIADKVKEAKFSNPSITLVGEVTKLRKKISWFESKPLFGKQILFGRTSEGASEMAEVLRASGAEVFEYPRFQTVEASSPESNFFKDFDHIVFHSPKSVHWFFSCLKKMKIDVRSIEATFYGASTKSIKALESFACFGLSKHEMIHSGRKLVIGPKSVGSATNLTEQYGEYSLLVSHEDIVVPQSNWTCRRLLDENRVDTIVFPSAESVRRVTEQIGDCDETPIQLSERAIIICFGPVSKQEAEKLGYQVDICLEEPSIDHLLQALQRK